MYFGSLTTHHHTLSVDKHSVVSTCVEKLGMTEALRVHVIHRFDSLCEEVVHGNKCGMLHSTQHCTRQGRRLALYTHAIT